MDPPLQGLVSGSALFTSVGVVRGFEALMLDLELLPRSCPFSLTNIGLS